jgi:hypothetical protein
MSGLGILDSYFGHRRLDCGMKVVTSPVLVNHHRKLKKKCRSTKKRIEKKWYKNKKNWQEWSTPSQEVYIVGNSIIAHPKVVNQIKREMVKKENRI